METSLYLPVKSFLEAAGYVVKGEIGGCDLVGLRDSEPPVIVVCELKLSFNLELILQAVDRATVADEVWIAARISPTGRGRGPPRPDRAAPRRPAGDGRPTSGIASSAGASASACSGSPIRAW